MSISLETIPGSPEKMNVDRVTTPEEVNAPSTEEVPAPVSVEPQGVEEPIPEPSSPKVKASSKGLLFTEATKTPAPTNVEDVNALVGLSPLTPIPPTPHPTNFKATRSRLNEVTLGGKALEEEDKDEEDVRRLFSLILRIYSPGCCLGRIWGDTSTLPLEANSS